LIKAKPALPLTDTKLAVLLKAVASPVLLTLTTKVTSWPMFTTDGAATARADNCAGTCVATAVIVDVIEGVSVALGLKLAVWVALGVKLAVCVAVRVIVGVRLAVDVAVGVAPCTVTKPLDTKPVGVTPTALACT